MKTIRRIFRPVAFLTAATAVLVACSAAAPAFARIVPPPAGAVSPPPPVVHTVTVGTPGWQIALLMAGTAVLAAAAAVLVERIRTARRAQVTEGAH